ncbi:MAG: hypothetical protein ACR2NP_13030 [Pirellulaceae bacterium]
MKANRRIWCLILAAFLFAAQGCGTGTYNDRYEERGGDLHYEADQ